MIYYVSCYFNYFGDVRRKELALEFMTRYKDKVFMYEYSYDGKFVIDGHVKIYLRQFQGFMNNIAFNDRLSAIRNNEDFEGLCFLDSDLLLSDNFFELLENRVMGLKGSYFIQPFSVTEELHTDTRIVVKKQKSIASKTQGQSPVGSVCEFDWKLHTGYAYFYSSGLLDVLGKLPECFVIGSYDTFLWFCLLRRKDLLDKYYGTMNLMDVYDRFEGVKVYCTEAWIGHRAHGNKSKRYLGRFDKYKMMNTEVMLDYFKNCRSHSSAS